MDVKEWLKKHWYWVAGGVVVLFLLLRARAGAAASRGIPANALGDTSTAPVGVGSVIDSTGDALAAAQSRTALAQEALNQQDIAQQSRLSTESGGLAEDILKYQRYVQDLLFKKASGTATHREAKLLKCPSGNFHIDPTTGEAYCRQEQSHGFFGDVLKPALSTALNTYAGTLGGVSIPARQRAGTPPIAPTSGKVIIPRIGDQG